MSGTLSWLRVGLMRLASRASTEQISGFLVPRAGDGSVGHRAVVALCVAARPGLTGAWLLASTGTVRQSPPWLALSLGHALNTSQQ